MEKEINLEEILLSKIKPHYYFEEMNNITNCPVELIVIVMKEAIKQSLELASENAHVSFSESRYKDPWVVNKQSILNTINQIK